MMRNEVSVVNEIDFFNNSQNNEAEVSLIEFQDSDSVVSNSKTTIKVPKQYMNETRYTVRREDLIKARRILCQIKTDKISSDDIVLSAWFLFIGMYLSWCITNKSLVGAESFEDIFQSFFSALLGLGLFIYVVLKRHFQVESKSKTISEALELLIDPEKEEEVENEFD